MSSILLRRLSCPVASLSVLGQGLAAAGLLTSSLLAQAQSAPAAAPAPAASAQTPPASPAVQQIEINGNKLSDVEERRRSTAAKIIVGRDEIERFGASSLGDVLKRLPGVTIGGNPGRGGQIPPHGISPKKASPSPAFPGHSDTIVDFTLANFTAALPQPLNNLHPNP